VPDQGKYLIINWHLENVNNILPSQDEDRTMAAVVVVVFAFGLAGVLKSKEGEKKKTTQKNLNKNRAHATRSCSNLTASKRLMKVIKNLAGCLCNYCGVWNAMGFRWNCL